MKKLSRLSLIVKGKELANELFNIKTRKIKRAVDSAIDRSEENALSCQEKVKTLLTKLGETYDNEEELMATINSICTTMDEADEWTKKHSQAKRIKELLEEEVEVEEEKK